MLLVYPLSLHTSVKVQQRQASLFCFCWFLGTWDSSRYKNTQQQQDKIHTAWHPIKNCSGLPWEEARAGLRHTHTLPMVRDSPEAARRGRETNETGGGKVQANKWLVPEHHSQA